MKRVWIISELYHPEENATGYYLTRIAEGLAEAERVEVLCAQPTYTMRGLRAPWNQNHRGVQIRRCRSTAFSHHRLTLRLLNAITISASLFLAAVRRIQKGDVVIVVTNPPTLPFMIALACRWRGAHGVLLVHDVYPEVLVVTGLLAATSPLARLTQWLTRKNCVAFERVVVLGRDMERLLQQSKGVPASRLVRIPNASEPDRIRPEPRSGNVVLQRLGLGDRFVLLYAGNMGRTHGLEIWMEVAARFQGTDVHLLFIGDGSRRSWFQETARARRLKNITIEPYPPRSEQSSMLNACDLAILSFVPGMSGVSVPSRIYGIMAAGKPILAIADSDSELARVIEEERIGWVVPCGRIDMVTAAIQHARANPDLLSEMGRRARAAAETRYDLATMISQYRRLVHDLGNENR